MQKKAKVQKKAELSFHISFGVAIIVLVVLLLAEDLLSRFDLVDVPEIFLQITAVALAATYATWLTAITYSHISTSTQQREWSRSILMKALEDIYLPVYQQIVSYAETVRLYRTSIVELWRSSDFRTKMTMLKIINPGYLERLRAHMNLYNRYETAGTEFTQAVRNLLESYHTNLFPGKDVRELPRMLEGERLYLAGRQVGMSAEVRRSYGSLYNTLGESLSNVKEDPGTTIDYLKSRVQDLQETTEFLSVHDMLEKDIERFIRITEEVVQKPYKVYLR